MKSIDFFSKGEHALQSHARSVKHKYLVDQQNKSTSISDYAVAMSSSSTASLSASGALSSSSAEQVVKNDTLKAEVLHCLKLIDQHNSYNSSTVSYKSSTDSGAL